MLRLYRLLAWFTTSAIALAAIFAESLSTCAHGGRKVLFDPNDLISARHKGRPTLSERAGLNRICWT